jgi:Tfp pilus assembly protein PilF
MRKFLVIFTIFALFSCAATPLRAEERRLPSCLDRAEAAPDAALSEAEAWLKQDGGDKAKLCRAFALFHRGDFAEAGKAFAELAARREESDKKHATSLHAQAGLAYMRANMNKKADAEYGAALRLEPQDSDIWMDRATERAANERFWDAAADLDKALAIMPDMSEALRLRGQIWMKLGLPSRAASDFEAADKIERAAKETSAKEPAAR